MLNTNLIESEALKKNLPLEARHSICLEISKKRRQNVASSIFIPKELSRKLRLLKMTQKREKMLTSAPKAATKNPSRNVKEFHHKKFEKLRRTRRLRGAKDSTRDNSITKFKHPESYPILRESRSNTQIREVVGNLRENNSSLLSNEAHDGMGEKGTSDMSVNERNLYISDSEHPEANNVDESDNHTCEHNQQDHQDQVESSIAALNNNEDSVCISDIEENSCEFVAEMKPEIPQMPSVPEIPEIPQINITFDDKTGCFKALYTNFDTCKIPIKTEMQTESEFSINQIEPDISSNQGYSESPKKHKDHTNFDFSQSQISTEVPTIPHHIEEQETNFENYGFIEPIENPRPGQRTSRSYVVENASKWVNGNPFPYEAAQQNQSNKLDQAWKTNTTPQQYYKELIYAMRDKPHLTPSSSSYETSFLHLAPQNLPVPYQLVPANSSHHKAAKVPSHTQRSSKRNHHAPAIATTVYSTPPRIENPALQLPPPPTYPYHNIESLPHPTAPSFQPPFGPHQNEQVPRSVIKPSPPYHKNKRPAQAMPQMHQLPPPPTYHNSERVPRSVINPTLPVPTYANLDERLAQQPSFNPQIQTRIPVTYPHPHPPLPLPFVENFCRKDITNCERNCTICLRNNPEPPQRITNTESCFFDPASFRNFMPNQNLNPPNPPVAQNLMNLSNPHLHNPHAPQNFSNLQSSLNADPVPVPVAGPGPMYFQPPLRFPQAHEDACNIAAINSPISHRNQKEPHRYLYHPYFGIHAPLAVPPAFTNFPALSDSSSHTIATTRTVSGSMSAQKMSRRSWHQIQPSNNFSMNPHEFYPALPEQSYGIMRPS